MSTQMSVSQMPVSQLVGTAVTVNAAFLQEIKEVHEDLWSRLKSLREICMDPVAFDLTVGRLAVNLDELRDQIALHFALEEAYGYFNDPQTQTPHLDEQAAHLRDEHQELYFMIDDLADSAEAARRGRAKGAVLDDLCDEFISFARRLDLHETMENELIFQMYDEDLGVGD